MKNLVTLVAVRERERERERESCNLEAEKTALLSISKNIKIKAHKAKHSVKAMLCFVCFFVWVNNF